jgi:heme o synthase
MTNTSESGKIDLVRFRRLSLTAAVMVFIVIAAGAVLRSLGTEAVCAEWPVCMGEWLPVGSSLGTLDLAHRLLSLLLVPLFLYLTFEVRNRLQQHKVLVYSVYAAAVLLLVQILFGAVVSAQAGSDLRLPVTGVHFGLSLLIQGLILIPVVLSYYLGDRTLGARIQAGLKRPSPFTRLSMLSLLLVFILMVTGAVVSAVGAEQACAGWPLCSGNLVPANFGELVNMLHRLVVLASAVVMAYQFLHAWRSQRSQTAVLAAATASGVLFFSQALMGAYRVMQGFPVFMIVLHEASSVAVLIALVVQVLAAGMAGRTAEEEAAEAAAARGRKGLAKDFLLLTKPIVVALLLVTTFAGMVIGAKSWPSVSLIFWTLLGGAMAAGGSGAINQYIDRSDDGKMQRTERRPIPSGRLTPGEGLAFGVGMLLASFYLVVAFVNLLAALLVLAGMIYYVLIYSIFLKKTTVQNIVIGGGAGAIPPLVGWAAATGSLNIPSLFLFAVVFLWTPPHFWALALVRRKDYARAGVPMLPVVRGEKETRWQIMIYSVQLVVLTLLLPLFGLGGALYLVFAVFLGAGLLLSAWKVWREGGNKLAWKMYRHSSMYLAFLFLALMVDALI